MVHMPYCLFMDHVSTKLRLCCREWLRQWAGHRLPSYHHDGHRPFASSLRRCKHLILVLDVKWELFINKPNSPCDSIIITIHQQHLTPALTANYPPSADRRTASLSRVYLHAGDPAQLREWDLLLVAYLMNLASDAYQRTIYDAFFCVCVLLC